MCDLKEPTPEDYAAVQKELREHKDDPAYLPILRRLCLQYSELMLLEAAIEDLEKEQEKPQE